MTRRELGLAALGHAALAAVSFARVWPRAATHGLSGSYDAGMNMWVQWWGPFALRAGLDPLRTDWLYHPASQRLTVDADLPRWALAAALSPLLDALAASHVIAAFSYAASGFLAYALLRRFSDSRAGCALGSLAFAYSAYRGFSLLGGHFELLQTQWAVLLLLALVDHLRAPGGRYGVLAAAGLLCATADPRTWMMTLLLGAALAPAALAGVRDPGRAARARGAALLLAALAVPRAWEAASQLGWIWGGASRHPEALAVGPRDVLLWPPHHALRQLGWAAPGEGFAESASGYLSPALLLLAGLGLREATRRPAGRALAAALLLFAALSALRGPLALLPGLSFLRVPARFMLGTTLLAGALASWGWEALAARLRPPLRRALWAAVAALLFLETNPLFREPERYWDRDQPALDALAARPGGAVIDLPLDMMPGMLGDGSNGLALLRATRHRHPVVNGHLSIPDRRVAKLSRDPGLRALARCQEADCGGLDAERWRRLRRELGVRWVIAGPEASPALAAAAAASPALARLAEGGGVTVYEVDER